MVAIGSPFGLDNTVTAGIVSAKGRDTGDYLPFIQTDVAVNPGNSGGPLINMQGEVIGINSQIYSRTGGFMGISFAIPIDEAMRVADEIKTTGKVVRGRIAVAIGEVTKDVAESLGLPNASGAMVSSVEPGGPADKAGVQPGDIIEKFAGRNVDSATDLPRMVGETKPGTRTSLTIWRKGQLRELQVTVGEMQPDKQVKAPGKKAPAPSPRPSNSLGIAREQPDLRPVAVAKTAKRGAGRHGGRTGSARRIAEGRRNIASGAIRILSAQRSSRRWCASSIRKNRWPCWCVVAIPRSSCRCARALKQTSKSAARHGWVADGLSAAFSAVAGAHPKGAPAGAFSAKIRACCFHRKACFAITSAPFLHY